jgi:hypothetical protein
MGIGIYECFVLELEPELDELLCPNHPPLLLLLLLPEELLLKLPLPQPLECDLLLKLLLLKPPLGEAYTIVVLLLEEKVKKLGNTKLLNKNAKVKNRHSNTCFLDLIGKHLLVFKK